jgi:hypothetical protein
MQLEKAIVIHQPISLVYLNQSSIFINLTTHNYFNSISYVLNHSDQIIQENICSGCNHAEFDIDISDNGEYLIDIVASNQQNEIKEKLQIYNLEYLDFSRKFECDGCEEDFIPRNRLVNVTISINASDDISGQLSDYFPITWEYIDSIQDINPDLNNDSVVNIEDLMILLSAWGECPQGQECSEDLNNDGFVDRIDIILLIDNWSSEENINLATVLEEYGIDTEILKTDNPQLDLYSETHNRVTWEIQSRQIQKSYYLISPLDFFPKQYQFFSSFQDHFSNYMDVFVHWFFKIRIAIPQQTSELKRTPEYQASFAYVSPNNPLYIGIQDENLHEIAIFPSKELAKQHLSIFTQEKSSSESIFIIQSDIHQNNIENIMIRYKTPKSQEYKLYKYDYNSQQWINLEAKQYSQDNDFDYFETYTRFKGKFKIQKTKRGVLSVE